jgi:hypothetical protein
MSRNSEVDMYDCPLVRSLPLVHMGLGSDHKGQQQCHDGQRDLDYSSHAPRLYQNNRPCAKDSVSDGTCLWKTAKFKSETINAAASL